MLENLYLCGSNNNLTRQREIYVGVVICLKICTFVVATTTYKSNCLLDFCCDLLENLYLCGSNNNTIHSNEHLRSVVICLKICTFVVATTTLTARYLRHYEL